MGGFLWVVRKRSTFWYISQYNAPKLKERFGGCNRLHLQGRRRYQAEFCYLRWHLFT
jgi:hypothetical protein